MGLEKIIKKSKNLILGSLIAAQAISFGGCESKITIPEEENVPYIEYQNEETNQEGQVTFETGETLQILDQETQEPIEDIAINYYTDDSEEYRILTITDETDTYLPARRYLANFENETVSLQRSQNQEYTFRELSENERGPFMKYMKENIENTNNSQRTTDCSNYIRTNRGDEVLRGDNIVDKMITYFVPHGGVLVEIVNFLQNLEAIIEGYNNFEEMTLSNNWDSYSLSTNEQNSQLCGLLIESNQPVINSFTKSIIEEGEYQGYYKIELDVTDLITYLDGTTDKTISCTGDGEEHNLYQWLTFQNLTHPGHGWGQWSINTDQVISEERVIFSQIMAGIPPHALPGDYLIYGRIYDDTCEFWPEGHWEYNQLNVGYTDTLEITIQPRK